MNFEEQVKSLSERYFTKPGVVREVLQQARMKPYVRCMPDFNHQAYNLTARYLRFNLYRSVSEE